ncbi:MAG TPA: 50S ribosomal protein L4 [Chthonomonadales bacterium]|nr:50S ribosomal protein L4 [Chthonomonadales bacterium]
MPSIPLYDSQGNEKGTLSLPESVFGVEVRPALVHQAVVAEEANSRQGTSDTKTRSEVRGGGKKPWRQKGTGRARQGSTRAPQWRHGGVVFGPHPRDHSKALPRKMRRGALRSALSAKVADGEVIGLDELRLAAVRTKDMAALLDRLPIQREVRTKHYESKGGEPVIGSKRVPHRTLVILPEYDGKLLLSCRNLPYVVLRYAPSFSVRDVVTAGRVVLTEGAIPKVEEVLGR